MNITEKKRAEKMVNDEVKRLLTFVPDPISQWDDVDPKDMTPATRKLVSEIIVRLRTLGRTYQVDVTTSHRDPTVKLRIDNRETLNAASMESIKTKNSINVWGQQLIGKIWAENIDFPDLIKELAKK